ncbi:MAG: biopolymer transporter ExbD [Planctomycetia bacterium]|nr:biopolymer transporter ExbD [Planctomycetia bacterium]
MSKTIQCPKCKQVQHFEADKLDEQGRFACQKCRVKIHVKRKAVSSSMMKAADEVGEEQGEAAQLVEFEKHMREEGEMDLTPMVDVTFLLLIFFMVTATFSMQKSLDLPAADPNESAEQSRTVVEIENDDDNIIIRVDEDNTIWVNDAEAPTDQEIIAKLREAKEVPAGMSGIGPSKLMIFYHPESRVETTVRAHDAGTAVGMEGIVWRQLSEENW